MSTRRRYQPRALTEQQINVLFVIGQNGPLSAGDVASHLLASDQRSRITTLENRGLVGRQYTGTSLRSGETVAYVLTEAGEAALSAADIDEDYDPLDASFRPDGADS